MIKGVNKQIIEISDLENKFFEKAVLYVRPEYAEVTSGKVKNSAKELVEKMSMGELWCFNNGNTNKKKTISKNRAKIILSCAFSGLLVLGVVYVLLTVI